MSIQLIAVALPYFVSWLFILFVVLNIMNNLDNSIPALLSLNVEVYR